MKIVVGTDHAGFISRNTVIEILREMGHTVIKTGAVSSEIPYDYPVVAIESAPFVLSGECDFGILICGTGIGVSIAANKIKGIRAALCHNVLTAQKAREHNNANILCMGGRVISQNEIKEITTAFVTTVWSNNERHIKRLNELAELEK